jgi:predicted O-linked N-acetylglucosamine transferase (SPINDLY family)
VFCCFNQFAKITPEIFHVWSRLLKAENDSVLWFFAYNNDVAPAYLRRAAARAGVAGERLIFAPYADHLEHLARLTVADIFLDTLPYNAHTTASDALRCGVPVVTCSGESFAARVAGSLLHAIGITETIARDMGEYESIALRLARDPNFRTSLRQRILANQATHPLFDTARFCRHLEAAYETMWETHCAGEMPHSFTVSPSRSFQ